MSHGPQTYRVMNWVLAILVGLVLVRSLPDAWVESQVRLAAWREDSSGQVSQPIPVEALVEIDSLSEVANTRARLRAQAEQAISEIRRHARPAGDARIYADHASIERALSETLYRLEEFRGTEQEQVLRAELLVLYAKAGRHQEWFETFLRAFLERPTGSLGVSWARQAWREARALGREEELRAAVQHAAEMPFDFPGRAELAGLLREMQEAAL